MIQFLESKHLLEPVIGFFAETIAGLLRSLRLVVKTVWLWLLIYVSNNNSIKKIRECGHQCNKDIEEMIYITLCCLPSSADIMLIGGVGRQLIIMIWAPHLPLCCDIKI